MDWFVPGPNITHQNKLLFILLDPWHAYCLAMTMTVDASLESRAAGIFENHLPEEIAEEETP